MKGIFITFEGNDGCGKTTQINLVSDYLKSLGYDVLVSREPGGTAISEKIRTIILDPDNKGMDPACEALLYAASRAQHVSEVIIPALEAGKVVICDRFVESSIVYQGIGRELGIDEVRTINDFAIKGCRPDITFLITLAPVIGIRRKIESGKPDRLEMENIKFHQKVFDGYEKLKEVNKRIVSIDGTKDIDEIQMVIREKIEKFLREGY